MPVARVSVIVVGLFVTVSAVACSHSEPGGLNGSASKPASTQAAYAGTLYARLGGEKAIRLIVDDFADRALKDPRVNFTRRGSGEEWQATPENVERFKTGLTRWLVERTGGPKVYAGRDMRTAHRGMQITPAEFAAAADDLRAALRQLNVEPAAAEELVAQVTKAGSAIVQKAATRPN